MTPAAALLLVPLVAPLSAPAAPDDEPHNDPALCPYCEGDPDRMATAGVVSHGGFPFGAEPHDTASNDAFLATSEVYWIETEHFALGLALGPYRVQPDERRKIGVELERLRRVLPAVKPSTRVLDPWLRAHLFAQRMEEAYARFLEIVRKDQSYFPEAGQTWLIGTPYRGEGPHAGQPGKYEVLVLETEAAHVAWLREHFGLGIRRTQRWNVLERGALTVATHLGLDGLRVDEALHGHLVFNVAHNLLDGYEFYAYDTPLWIHVGLSHLMEREVTLRFNTFDAQEGTVPAATSKDEWVPEVQELVAKGEAPRLAELLAKKTYGEFDLDDNYVAWSMVDYLVREHPEGFACLNDALHGRKDAQGMPDGASLLDVHREAFRECLGMGYAEFDRAWAAWAAALRGRQD